MRLRHYNRFCSSGTITATQGAAYYPFGLAIDTFSYSLPTDVNTTPNPYLYNGKELQTQLGLQWLDYGARMYDAQVGRWWSVDPMAEKRNGLTPYQYAQNNSVLRIDPNGMLDPLYLKGDAKNEAFIELQKSKTLTLVMDENGKVSAQGDLVNENDYQLFNVISDKNVDVIVNATTYKTINHKGRNRVVPDGIFLGSDVSLGKSKKIVKDDIIIESVNSVIAYQAVNPLSLMYASSLNGMPGQDMLHEVTEAYKGGKISQESGHNVGPAGEANLANPVSVYNKAHGAAIPQSCNNFGVEINNNTGSYKYYIQNSNNVYFTYP